MTQYVIRSTSELVVNCTEEEMQAIIGAIDGSGEELTNYVANVILPNAEVAENVKVSTNVTKAHNHTAGRGTSCRTCYRYHDERWLE